MSAPNGYIANKEKKMIEQTMVRFFGAIEKNNKKKGE